MFRIFVYGTLRVPNPETPRADVMYHAQIAHWVLANKLIAQCHILRKKHLWDGKCAKLAN
ncbi:MAG TPA: hypothetical protein PK299_14445 [Anaerolineales bacterium]|nr:hypothetical protein [Anaerolineales bacterium]